jgi:hypothetical protein
MIVIRYTGLRINNRPPENVLWYETLKLSTDK